MNPLLIAAVASFAAFSLVGGFDATYYHFHRFRLWSHPETRVEHALHAARAALFPPTLLFLFTPGRAALIAAAALVTLDFVAAALDVLVERKSRVRFGGLPHGEYAAHVFATVFHVVGETLVFAARLRSDIDPTPTGWARILLIALGAASALATAHHLVLLSRGVLGGSLKRPRESDIAMRRAAPGALPVRLATRIMSTRNERRRCPGCVRRWHSVARVS